MKRILITSFFALSVLGLSSCLKANRPPSQMEDVNAGNERIYGKEGAPARQSEQTYDKLPDEIQRADRVRNILYPS